MWITVVINLKMDNLDNRPPGLRPPTPVLTPRSPHLFHPAYARLSLGEHRARLAYGRL